MGPLPRPPPRALMHFESVKLEGCPGPPGQLAWQPCSLGHQLGLPGGGTQVAPSPPALTNPSNKQHSSTSLGPAATCLAAAGGAARAPSTLDPALAPPSPLTLAGAAAEPLPSPLHVVPPRVITHPDHSRTQQNAADPGQRPCHAVPCSRPRPAAVQPAVHGCASTQPPRCACRRARAVDPPAPAA